MGLLPLDCFSLSGLKVHGLSKGEIKARIRFISLGCAKNPAAWPDKKLASATDMRKSQASTMPMAPPAAVPLIAAIVKPEKLATALDKRSQSGLTASLARAASRSAPELNTRLLPVKINTLVVAISTVLENYFNMLGVSALAFSGRFIVRIKQSPSSLVWIMPSQPNHE